jgi:redox-sensitive bicupin YhaK (pirin superfamily)
MASTATPRDVVKKFESIEQSEGVGARVRRSIGRPELKQLDPFLMLDEFNVGRPAGFPDHPHRGMETVTFMLQGQFKHEDFAGHKGVIGPGDLQWMTAGRGIVHCEMPMSKEACTGLQLWVNLKKKDKMVEPAYQELKDKDIPRAEKDGVWVKVIAGTSLGVSSPVRTRSPTMYLEFKIQPGKEFIQDVPDGWNAFAYTISGKALFGNNEVEGPAHHTILFSDKNGGVKIKTTTEEAHFVVIAGEPTNEPTVQYGPFVMSSQQEINEAMRDYQGSSNGFERARGWESEEVRSRNNREF